MIIKFIDEKREILTITTEDKDKVQKIIDFCMDLIEKDCEGLR